ncbi:hypothetical protein EVAR_12040_1 [Eumeta japonica]|uniref:Serpin domain-containing protein n=1 Tax=Eumeta variegata TaxID=151549 RepID=A0A4C1U557_EUMVA|nr:hypothetical protein EVAR_12040_1 [Eumeta japonica]
MIAVQRIKLCPCEVSYESVAIEKNKNAVKKKEGSESTCGIASFASKSNSERCHTQELEKNKNVVSSPLSAEILLALITLGANDPAHSELLKALDFPDDEFIRSSFTTVSQKFKTIKGVTLNVANKVYIKEGSYDLAPEIKKDAVDVFDADFEKVDFGDSAAAAALINKWVESKTNERIKDLLESDSISDDTRLILVNALYFKGNWKKQFDVHATIDHPFHTSLTDTVNVHMMNMEDHFRYGEDQELDVKLLEMPYTGDEASMLIILPNQIDGLPNVMQKLANGYDIMGAVEKMFSTKVRVMVPRFKIETTIDLKELLPKLGINAIFNSQNSGLDRILNTPEKIYVSEAIQKAFIEVNEEGAEAAAATGILPPTGLTQCPTQSWVHTKTALVSRGDDARVLRNATGAVVRVSGRACSAGSASGVAPAAADGVTTAPQTARSAGRPLAMVYACRHGDDVALRSPAAAPVRGRPPLPLRAVGRRAHSALCGRILHSGFGLVAFTSFSYVIFVIMYCIRRGRKSLLITFLLR